MKKIVLASNNKHKIKEIKEILNNYEILTLNDIEYFDEIEETGNTFLENALIKAKIEDLKGKDNTAYFDCTIVLYHINGTYEIAVGKTYGKIIEEEKGDTSFGYDSIFLSDELRITFGEASNEEKNKVSHRYKALIKIKELLK